MKPQPLLKTLAVVAVLMISATIQLVALPKPAQSGFFYTWGGDCLRGCPDSSIAALLVGNTYTPGTLLFAEDIRVLFYTTQSGPFFTVFNEDIVSASGILPPLPIENGPVAAAIFIDLGGATDFFQTSSSSALKGAWTMVYLPAGVDHAGDMGGWFGIQLPVPGTLSLFGVGLAALALIGRRAPSRPSSRHNDPSTG